MGKLKSLRQPASADFWVFSTYFLGNFSTFCCINLKQEVEKPQKSAETGCLKLLGLPSFFFFFFFPSVGQLLIRPKSENSMSKVPKSHYFLSMHFGIILAKIPQINLIWLVWTVLRCHFMKNFIIASAIHIFGT